MTGLDPITLAIAFAGGVVSFASPCVLALVPGYLAFVSGVSVDRLEERPRAVLGPTLVFVGAFALLFTMLGAGLGGVSATLRTERRLLEWIGGALLIGFGLLVALGPRMGLLQRELRPLAWPVAGRGRLVGAGLAGLAFGIGWTPCIGPILGSILTFAAAGASPWGGALLLFTYALGLGVPFILTGLALGGAMRAFRRLRRIMPLLTAVAAIGMIGMGVLVATGQMHLLTAQLSQFNQVG